MLIFALIAGSAFAGCLSSDDSGSSPNSAVDGSSTGSVANESDLIANGTLDDGSGMFNESHAGHLPHVHNYWTGREKVTLMEESISVEVLSQQTFNRFFSSGGTQLGGAYFALPDGQIVYEGTGKMLITASWTESTITSLALQYRHASSREFGEIIPLSSGETLEVAITPDMTDMAHQQATRWRFDVHAGGGAVDVAQGNVQFKVEIVRVRDIGVLPGHPETYVNVDKYDILDANGVTKNYNLATYIAAEASNTRVEDWIAPTDIVRMGTAAIIAEVTVTNAGDTAISSVSGVRLDYRAATTTFWQNRAQFLPDLSDTANGKYVFGIYVDDGTVDGPYDKESMWRFRATPEERVATGNACRWMCGGAELQYHITAITFNEDPTGGTLVPPERNRGE